LKRIYVLTEGPTEEAFVKNVLAPHLFAFDKWPEATSVCTHHERGRRAFRGGALSYNRVRRDLLRLLGSRPEAVTTMFDYYALRGDLPGWDSLPDGGAAAARARHLETALAADIDDARFIPNLVLHEYEGLLFSSPRTIAEVLLDTKHVEALEAIAKGADPDLRVRASAAAALLRFAERGAARYRPIVSLLRDEDATLADAVARALAPESGPNLSRAIASELAAETIDAHARLDRTAMFRLFVAYRRATGRDAGYDPSFDLEAVRTLVRNLPEIRSARGLDAPPR